MAVPPPPGLPIHLSNGAPPRARQFRYNSEAPNNFILLKTSVSLFIVPSACWAWRRQLEKRARSLNLEHYNQLFHL